MLLKCYTQYASKFENLSSGHRTGKGQFSIQSQRKVKVKSLSRVQLFGTPWTVAYQAPLSMGFSRQECWSGLPFPSPRDLPNPGIEPRSPACRQTLYRLSHQGSPMSLKVSPNCIPETPLGFPSTLYSDISNYVDQKW